MSDPEREEPDDFFWLDFENLPDRESFIRYGPPRDLWHTVTAIKARGEKLPKELARRVVEASRAPPGYVYPDPRARIPLMTDPKPHTKKSQAKETTTLHPESHRQRSRREAGPIDSNGIGLESKADAKKRMAVSASTADANPPEPTTTIHKRLSRRVVGLDVESSGIGTKSKIAAKERDTINPTPAGLDPPEPSTITDGTGLHFTVNQTRWIARNAPLLANNGRNKWRAVASEYRKAFNQDRKPESLMLKYTHLKNCPGGVRKFLAENSSEDEDEEQEAVVVAEPKKPGFPRGGKKYTVAEENWLYEFYQSNFLLKKKRCDWQLIAVEFEKKWGAKKSPMSLVQKYQELRKNIKDQSQGNEDEDDDAEDDAEEEDDD
ncbi:hypothetical protein RUND412_011335 [Rhizina undulata]